RLGALPHLDEERVTLRLGDEADDIGSLCGASKEAGQRDARERYLEMLQRDHELPPMKPNAGRPAYPTRAPSSHGPPSGAAKHQPARLSIIKSLLFIIDTLAFTTHPEQKRAQACWRGSWKAGQKGMVTCRG